MKSDQESGNPSWMGGMIQQDWGGVEFHHNGHSNGENDSWYHPDEARRIGQALIDAADYAEQEVRR